MSRQLSREDLDNLVMGLVSNETEEMWDYPTMLFLIVDLPTEEKWGLMLREDLSEMLNRADRGPVEVLQTMAVAMTLPFAPDFPHGLHKGEKLLGFVIRNEGWRLSVPEDLTREELDEFTASGKRYVDHPKAKETRGYTAVTSDEATAALQVRHEQPAVMPSIDGRVAEVLQLMLTAFKARFPEYA